ncbi:MAG TPA: response regulator [Desulfobacterales bacterium]|nr:response regulator [Desulfobacterales bacterium]HIP38190.1 response regulator [Desulfocapsa sulfexigens]
MTNSKQPETCTRLLIVDDSWVLRKIMRTTFSQRDDVEIVGEATNGIEALEQILKLDPDVILLDMEMPIMDGMTTLQHLMIHTPIPTIMLSSLSKTGTARCFDALKYGAVDFVGKNTFFQSMDSASHSKLVFGKVFDAASMVVESIDPMCQRAGARNFVKGREKVIFCEDCGTRHIIFNWNQKCESKKCMNCGDEISLLPNKRYLRMNFLTVIGTGKSGYANLLKIIPFLDREMGGALCVMILDKPKYVASFVKYLDSISDLEVVLGHNGTTLEGGCCYIFSGADTVQFSPYSGHYTMQIETDSSQNSSGNIDKIMSAAAVTLKDRVAGVLLSGSEADGNKGIEAILQENGTCMILKPGHCLQKHMSSKAIKQHDLEDDLDEANLAIKIQENHFINKENVITA